MELTPERKAHIDSLSCEYLLWKSRFAPAGDPWFQGETGVYLLKRLSELRNADPEEYVRASKSISIGWER